MVDRDAVLAVLPPYFRRVLHRVRSSEVGYRFAWGAFWTLAGTALSRALSMVAAILVARMLGKAEYGAYGIIDGTVGMFGVFAGFGLGLTATKHVAEYRRKDPVLAGQIIVLSSRFSLVSGCLIAGLLVVLAPWLAQHVLAAPHLGGTLRIGAGMLLLDAVSGAQRGALSGLEAFKVMAARNALSGIISLPVMIVFTYFAGVKGAISGLVVTSGVNCVLNHLALRREALRADIPLSSRGAKSAMRVLWRFSLPAVLAGAIVGPVNWICSTMLVNRPAGYAEMGVYMAAGQWFNMLLFIPGLLGQVLLPILSERMSLDGASQPKRVLRFSVALNVLIVVPVAVLMSILSPYIMQLYGSEFAAGWPTLVLVLITASLLAIQLPLGQVIVASGRMWVAFIMSMAWGALFVLLAICLTTKGSFGLAMSRCLAYCAHGVWTAMFVVIVLHHVTQPASNGVLNEQRL